MVEVAERAIHALPTIAPHIVGRDEVIGEICQRVADRFVSIVGPGGIGKTTVAVSVANRLLNDFDGAVCFLELGAVAGPHLIDQTIAAAFGLPVHSDDPIPELISHLRGKRILLILDSCEHVLSKVGELADRLVRDVPELCVLATSREALGQGDEYILRLPPLESPPGSRNVTASVAISFPAVQLFAQRAASGGARIALTDDVVAIVADMCRKLGGIPLAIELVAAQVGDHGVRETAALLDSQFALRWPGRRTAPPRHHTISATLDWSYNLLSSPERLVLRQLSVFAGGFTIDAARAVISSSDDKIEAPTIVANLVAKSLLSVDINRSNRYRLLDSTRAYASLKLTGDVERQALKRRHALHFNGWLREAAANARSVKRELSLMGLETDNVRAALDWAFSASGDQSIAIDLAVGSLPLWLGQALHPECENWMLKALALARHKADVSTQQRLSIQMALGGIETFRGGLSKKSAGTWVKALKLADRVGDSAAQLTCLFVIWTWELRETWYGAALATAERRYKVAKATGDLAAIAMSDWMVGHSQHHVGQLGVSRRRLQHLLDTDIEEARLAQTTELGYDRKVDALGVLANTLWTQGFFEQARRVSAEAIDEARALGLPSPFGVAMTWAGFNTYLSGVDLDGLERDMAELVEHGRAHSHKHEEGFGQCILGLCRTKRGDYAAGAPVVTEGLRLLMGAHMLSFNPIILAHLVEAAAHAGRLSEARSFMERLIRQDRNPEHWGTPEILRVKAELAIAEGDELTGEQLLMEALAMATKQGALAWLLKSTTSLARLRASQGHPASARKFLEPIYNAITEGFDAADMHAATQLLHDLR
jgi:predicted ATPase